MDETLAKWVEAWSISGNDKLEWERFFNKYCPQKTITMTSSTQTTEMTIDQKSPPKDVVETVIVWNGNGARARLANKAELRQVVQAADPDVLCFLEGKTDAEHLLHISHFRDWSVKSQYRQVNCYWSIKDDRKAFGSEGIILFSKLPCKVTYGLGDEVLDKQARVLTAEFSDCVMLFTYNPQGGFTLESQAFRKKWEAALIEYIRKLKVHAFVTKKKMVWAGDFNVNPTRADWSLRAFDRIKHRIPEGTLPMGCREEDQKAYRSMVAELSGINLAEHFKKPYRTCFPSEEYLRKDYGQRIDHVIVEPDLLDAKSDLRIAAFDTLVQFGGSRKESSDHCPLWFKFERGEAQPEQIVAPVAVAHEKTPVKEVDANLMKKVRDLFQPHQPHFEDLEPTPEFQNARPEDEECIDSQFEDFACGVELNDDFKERPFEDCSSPIIQCCVMGATQGTQIPVKVLVDSGSTLDLISGKMARKLASMGHTTKIVNRGVKIKVANGKKSVLTQVMPLQLVLQEELTEPVEWLVLEDLPFDMILGSETCKKWKAVTDWGNSTFSITPGNVRIEVDWNLYRGQHWRKPVVLTARETVKIPPYHQMIIGVNNTFNEADGYACKAGLVTPTREEAVMSQKFSVAYMYGEDIDRVVAANTSRFALTITAGTPVAEFHARSSDSMEIRPNSAESVLAKCQSKSQPVNPVANMGVAGSSSACKCTDTRRVPAANMDPLTLVAPAETIANVSTGISSDEIKVAPVACSRCSDLGGARAQIVPKRLYQVWVAFQPCRTHS